jgi:L-asparaginase
VSSARVVVLATGGTIASVRRADGYRPGLAASDLSDGGIDGVDVEFRDLAAVNSFDLTPTLLHHIAASACQVAADPDVAGVVVTHGTDTMEETSFLTSLMHDGDAPIVFTGAQVPGGDEVSDGPANLRRAITTAASEDRRGGGVSIAVAGSDLPALGVVKHSTVDAAAFVSRSAISTPRVPAPFPELTGLDPRVRLITSAVGDDGRAIDDAVTSGERGLVLQAFGTGNVGAAAVAAVRRAIARDLLVVVTSRCAHGPVRPVYGGGGGGVDLAAAGAVFAGDLGGPQARVLSMAALADRSTDDAAERVRRFLAAAANQVPARPAQ